MENKNNLILYLQQNTIILASNIDLSKRGQGEKELIANRHLETCC